MQKIKVLLAFLRTSHNGSIAEMFRRAEEELEKTWLGFFRNVLMGIPRCSRSSLCRELGICRGFYQEPIETSVKAVFPMLLDSHRFALYYV